MMHNERGTAMPLENNDMIKNVMESKYVFMQAVFRYLRYFIMDNKKKKE
jgi:hypothetical protein